MKEDQAALETSNGTNVVRKQRLEFQSLRLSAFGRFIDTELELDDGVNVIFGPNEAGKSTLYSFLYTMLFGVYPTKPEQHAYYPFDGRHMVGSLVYRGENGRIVEVERKLMSGPTGRIIIDGQSGALNQNTVPEADFLTKEVFASVFALDIDDLKAPSGDDNVWADIQDRLLGGMNMDFLAPARKVAETLETEAGTYWGETNRANHRVKVLGREIIALRDAESEAARRSQVIREATDEKEATDLRVRALHEERDALDKRLARLQRVVPLRRKLLSYDERRTRAGEIDRYNFVPEDALGALEEAEQRQQELSERIKQLELRRGQGAALISAVTDFDRLVHARRQDVREWEVRCGELKAQRHQRKETREKQDHLQRELEEFARGVLSTGWSPEAGQRLGDVSPADLRAAVNQHDRASKAEADLQRRYELSVAERKSGEDRPWYLVIAAGLVITIIGVMVGEWFVVAIGILALAVAAERFLAARRNASPEEDLAEQLEEARHAREAARNQIRVSLNGLAIPSDRHESPDSSLVQDVERLIRLRRDVEAAQHTESRLSSAIHSAESELRTLAEELTIEFVGVDATVRRMTEACEAAATRISEAERLQKELPEIEREIVSHQDQVASLSERIGEIRSALEELGAGDVASGAGELSERRNARERAAGLLEEIIDAEGSLEFARSEVQETIESDPELFQDGVENRLSEVRRAVEDERFELGQRSTELKANIEQWNREPTLADVQSEIERLQEELADARWQRDRLALAAAIVREADRRFRAEHQPDVIKRASRYFKTMTGGRYDRIMLDGESLSLNRADIDRQIDLAAMRDHASRGTRDQLYLAIRLGLIDHLDTSHVRLPVLLDEVFVNWDEQRRVRGYDVLRSMADERQLIFFTCHEWFRDEVEEHLSANVVTLSP